MNAVMTREEIERLDDATVKALGRVSAYKSISMAVLQERAKSGLQDAIDFSKQDLFEVGGALLPLFAVMAIADSDIPSVEKSGVGNTGNAWHIAETPVWLAMQAEAKEVLKKYRKGIVAEGGAMSLTRQGFRAFIG